MSVNPNFAKSQPRNKLCLPDEIVPMLCGFTLYETAAQAQRSLLNRLENFTGEGHATLAFLCSRREQMLWRIQFLAQTKSRRIGRGS